MDTRSYYVTNHHGQRSITGPRGDSTNNEAQARKWADELRAEAVAAGKAALHYNVVAIEHVYTTSSIGEAVDRT